MINNVIDTFKQLSKKFLTGSILKNIITLVLGFSLFLTLAIGLLFAIYAFQAPKLSEETLKATSSSLVYDKDNNLIADLGAEKRDSVASDNIPIELVNAVISIEDHRFFQHRGVDVYRILGSLWNNLTSDRLQGGSTLDQQLIKLAYFSTADSDRTIKRKVQEIWLSLQMEREYSKEEILTFYINKVFMGNGNYGMKTAAKAYFGKDLKDLSTAQMALLAGIPQAPSQYDPYHQPDIATERRNIVLSQMLRHNYISQEEYDIARDTPITEGLQPLPTGTAGYPKYMDNYLTEVIKEVKNRTGLDIFTAGLKVYTNVDSEAQQHLWNIYNTYDYINFPDDKMQVASTVIDVTNGHVIAQLGARKQADDVSFGTNQATLTDRDWGSTMKPITDYAPALDNDIYQSTAESIIDAPYNWPGTYTPLYNWDRQYYGSMTLQNALAQSRNIPAVKVLEKTGLDKASQFLANLGIEYPEMYYSNSISSLTSSLDSKYGASSEKMAAAYAALANGGIYNKPQYVNKIEFSDGTSETYSPEGKRAMKETTAYMMTDMLKSVLTYGTGTRAQISGIYQAGKTGTSDYTDTELEQIEANLGLHPNYVGLMAPDENFVGYTPQYSMAVWTGYKNRLTPIYGNSLQIAAEVYRHMMLYLTNGYNQDWVMPDGLYRRGGHLYLNHARPTVEYYTYDVEELITETNSSEASSSEESSSEELSDTLENNIEISEPATSNLPNDTLQQ